MSRKAVIFLAVFAALMLSIGLLIPTGVEWISSRSIGTEQTVQVEAIDYQAGSGTLMDILNMLNSSADITEQAVKEGYNYSSETASAHAKELVLDYLKACGIPEMANFWAEQMDDRSFSCDGILIAVPEFPSPWSAVLWNVEAFDGNGNELSAVFDDATGALLGVHITQENAALKNSDQNQLSDAAPRFADAYAKGLGNLEAVDFTPVYRDEETGEQSWGFSVIDSEGKRVDVVLYLESRKDGRFTLALDPMGAGSGEAIADDMRH